MGIINKFYEFLIGLGGEFLEVAHKYTIPHSRGEIKSKVEKTIFNKPAVFVEGEHDITYIRKAASLLGKDVLIEAVEIRQRGGYRNLDKLWELYKDSNWETVPQKKILLYDCDTQKKDEDLGYVYKRIIPTLPDGYVNKGIENLIPKAIIEKAIGHKRAFVDFKKITGVERGVDFSTSLTEVNKDEKKNFCQWICDNGTAEDFKHFEVIFKIIESII